jgi:CheY-like chemotaxis protein
MTTTHLAYDETAAERPLRVLLADDDEVLLLILTRQLRKHGFEVFPTGCSGEAVEMYCRSAERIDLVLLDVNMPGMGGPAALDDLLAADPGVRCCFITADLRADTRTALLARGALAVFGKPFPSVADLCSDLRRLAGPPAAATHAHSEGSVQWTS